MKKKLFLKFFVLAVIGAFVTFTSCKDYDDDISKLNTDLSALKAEVANKSDLSTLKTDLEGKISALQTELNGLKADLGDLDFATQKDLDDLKAEILAKTVALETYNNFKEWVEGEIAGLKADLAKAATKEEVEALQTLLESDIADLRADLAAHIANFDALKLVVDGHSDAIADIQGELVDQLALINANKDEIAAVKADLQEKYDELTAEINALKSKVSDLEAGLDALDAKVDAIKTELEGKIADLDAKLDAFIVDIKKELGEAMKLLRSLVLIPHHYVNGVEAIGFNPIEYICKSNDETILANPNYVTVGYKVNPSTVEESVIDKENLSFTYRYKENHLRSADINPKAEFVSLEDGILTVRVLIDANFAEIGGWFTGPSAGGPGAIDKMDMIALQVPLLDPDKDAIITSDWGRIDATAKTDPVIDRVNFLCDEDGVTYSKDYPTAQDAKDADVEGDIPYVLELVYDESHNLLDYVTSTADLLGNCDEFDPADYGLVWNFDLLDENDDAIVYKLTNLGTDQQDFIKLLDNKGNIEAKVYTTSGTDAIGRTPIVRAQLIDTATGCVVTEGFVKIKWVKEHPTHDVTYPSQDVDFTCDMEETTGGGYHSAIGFGVDIEWMNVNVYNAMDTYYEEFNHNNELDVAAIYDENGQPVDWGVVVENADFGNTTDTDLFNVYLSDVCEVTEATSFTGYVHYVSKMDNDIVTVRVKVTLDVNMPTLTVAGHNNNLWQNGNNSSNVMVANPVQFKNATQVNPTVNYRSDLLNGFTDGTTYTDEIAKIVKSSIAGHTPCNVEFVFDAEALKSYEYTVGTTVHKVANNNLQVSSDGKAIEFYDGSSWVVATTIKSENPLPSTGAITHKGETINLDEDGDEAEAVGDSWPGKFARALVGKKVPVKLAADLCCETECDLSRDIRKFEVYFVPPMKINSTFTDFFTDWTIDDYINLDKAFTLTDFAGYLVAEAADNPNATNPLARYTHSLWEYYEIDKVIWDDSAITCNLGGNPLDVVPGANNPLPLNYLITYIDSSDADHPNSLLFQNTTGVTMGSDFEIYVPVKVVHKWGTLSATVTITVKKHN